MALEVLGNGAGTSHTGKYGVYQNGNCLQGGFQTKKDAQDWADSYEALLAMSSKH